MRPLFFSPTETTSLKGRNLTQLQQERLTALLEGILASEPEELAGRICRQVLDQADWESSKGCLEILDSEPDGFRLHLNLPLTSCMAQMQLYTWQDEENGLCLGIGTTDCTDYALLRLQDQGLIQKGHQVLDAFKELN